MPSPPCSPPSDALSTGADLGEGAINVGTGVETSVLELLDQLSAIAGQPAEPELAPHRTGEIERVSIDPALAQSKLGWSPATTLADGLRVTFEDLGAGRR